MTQHYGSEEEAYNKGMLFNYEEMKGIYSSYRAMNPRNRFADKRKGKPYDAKEVNSFVDELIAMRKSAKADPFQMA